jgi:hypothetical protein
MFRPSFTPYNMEKTRGKAKAMIRRIGGAMYSRPKSKYLAASGR